MTLLTVGNTATAIGGGNYRWTVYVKCISTLSCPHDVERVTFGPAKIHQFRRRFRAIVNIN